MRYYFAPLEGITGYIYRGAHSRYYPGVDKYFAPFISTNQNHRFTNREMRDILPENNHGVNVVPQLLGKVPEEFVSATRVLRDMGYGEVNLNLGCPSSTVTAKGKGAGALADPERLERYLDGIFSNARVKISIKTRLGVSDPDEFYRIIEIYNRYPVCELTIHPRVRKDMYKNPVRLDAFAHALKESLIPVCYNGELKTAQDCAAIGVRFPKSKAVMLGRGLIADPALVTRIKGGRPASKETLRCFHDELYEGYRRTFQNDRNAMMRMKELWVHMIGGFRDGDAYGKKLRKVSDPADYSLIVRLVFDTLEIRL